MNLTEQQNELLEYVKLSHGEQKRKYTGEPYWTHPLAVAEIVNKYDQTDGLIEIALCHDLFEDTHVTYDILKDELTRMGYTVAQKIFILRGVEALTDGMTAQSHPHLNRAVRKQFDAHALGKVGGNYQTVKYADLIHNTESILLHDKGFAKVYIKEKRYVFNLMRNGNLELFIECYNSLLSAEKELGITP